jgi:hypothetical protein
MATTTQGVVVMDGYSYSWTQSYPGWPRPTLTKEQAAYTLATLLIMHEIDELVDKGLTCSEADAILKRIANNSKGKPNA